MFAGAVDPVNSGSGSGDGRGRWLVGACGPRPVGREGYTGTPLRAAINAECTAELVDAREQPCVQIDVFAEGEGPAAVTGEWVDIHYMVEVEGEDALLDSSHGGKPFAFKLHESGNVIDGMQIGVDGMRVGERRRFVVPPKLGYRGQKMPGIPPEANLVFFVELVQLRTELWSRVDRPPMRFELPDLLLAKLRARRAHERARRVGRAQNRVAVAVRRQLHRASHGHVRPR